MNMGNVISGHVRSLVEREAGKLLKQHRAQIAEADRQRAAGYDRAADSYMADLPIQVTEPRKTYERRLEITLANCSAINSGHPRQHGESDDAYAARLACTGAPIARAAHAMAALTLLDEADEAARKAEAERQAAQLRADHERAVRSAADGARRVEAFKAALAAEAKVTDAEYHRAVEVLALAVAGDAARRGIADAVSGVNWSRSALGQAPIAMPDVPDAPAGAVALIEAARAR
jgi:hypothetical protein